MLHTITILFRDLKGLEESNVIRGIFLIKREQTLLRIINFKDGIFFQRNLSVPLK